MPDDAALALGKAQFEKVYPFAASAVPSDWERIMYEDLFGGVYQRPGLNQRDRRLLILGVAAAQGNEPITRLQLRSGIVKGDIKREDVEEILIFLTQYVGYPLATRFRAAAAEALKDLT
jgi:4-carboxymuconolactone decarboxylase